MQLSRHHYCTENTAARSSQVGSRARQQPGRAKAAKAPTDTQSWDSFGITFAIWFLRDVAVMRPQRWPWALVLPWHNHHSQHKWKPIDSLLGGDANLPAAQQCIDYPSTSPPMAWSSPWCCFHQKSSFILPAKPRLSAVREVKRVGPRSMDSLSTKTKTASANADVSQLFIVTRTYNYPLTVSRARYLEPSLGRVTVRFCFQPHPTFKWGKKKNPTTKEQLTG